MSKPMPGPGYAPDQLIEKLLHLEWAGTVYELPVWLYEAILEHLQRQDPLIADAPELLEALERAERRLRNVAAVFNDSRFTDRAGDGAACEHVADVALTALRKAKGEL